MALLSPCENYFEREEKYLESQLCAIKHILVLYLNMFNTKQNVKMKQGILKNARNKLKSCVINTESILKFSLLFFRSLGMQSSSLLPHQDLFLLGSRADESRNTAAALCNQVLEIIQGSYPILKLTYLTGNEINNSFLDRRFVVRTKEAMHVVHRPHDARWKRGEERHQRVPISGNSAMRFL